MAREIWEFKRWLAVKATRLPGISSSFRVVFDLGKQQRAGD